MSSNKIDGKIQDFIKANPLVRGKSQEEILSIMADCWQLRKSIRRSRSSIRNIRRKPGMHWHHGESH